MTTFSITDRKADGRTCYGISVKAESGRLYTYPDVSSVCEEARRLVNRLKQSDLAECHFNDVVRDYLFELLYERLERNGL